MEIKTKIGFGVKASGEVELVEEKFNISRLDNSLAGKILILLDRVTREFLEKASLVGVAGLVAPSIHWRDYVYMENQNDFPLLITEKFGNLKTSEETAKKLEKFSSKKASLDGEEKTLTA